MTDDDLLTEIRDRMEPARMTVPLDMVVTRGQARRRRGRLLAAAEMAAGAAAAAAIAVAVIPGPAPATTASHLAAWTVTTQAGGDVRVTIRSARDLGGLQAALRARGAPVFVRFYPSTTPGKDLLAKACPSGFTPPSFMKKLPPDSGINIGGQFMKQMPLEEAPVNGDDWVGRNHVATEFIIHTKYIPRGIALGIVMTVDRADIGGRPQIDSWPEALTATGLCIRGPGVIG